MSDKYITDGFNHEEWFKREKKQDLLFKDTCKKRYFKTNKKTFTFMNKHPEFRIEHIYLTAKNIVVLYSNKLGRPKNTSGRHTPNFEGFRPLNIKK